MTTTPHWRNVPGLTAEQTHRLTQSGHLMTEVEQLDTARDFAADNLLQASLAHITAPAGTVRTTRWCGDGDHTARDIYGKGWSVGDVNARIVGQQDITGATVWRVELDAVEGTVGGLTAVQALELAGVLTEAAEELDRLNGDSPPFM